MERLIFKEEQSFRQTFLPWIMLAACLVAIGGFGFSFYQQFYPGKPYGNEPLSNNDLVWSALFSFAVMSAAFIFILNGRLITEVWTDGIRYKFPPLIRKTKHIQLDEIASVEVGKYRPVAEFGGWGWRRRILSGKTAFNISGRMGMRVMKKNGRQVLFGTLQPDEMKRAANKMMQPDTRKYTT